MYVHKTICAAAICALLLGVVPAGAQVRSAPPGSAVASVYAITVVGRGSVRVPADRMRVAIRLFGRSTATGTVANVDDAGKTIAEALRAHGMPDAAWVLPLSGMFGQGSGVPQIVGTVDKPTRERVETIMRDTLKALPDALAAVVQGAQILPLLFVEDCASAEARAQKAALADAQRRAEMIARAAGVRLGAVIAVNEPGFVPACLSPNDFGVPGYNQLDVSIVVSATVSYAIR
jgi:uncharacterized protein YggE